MIPLRKNKPIKSSGIYQIESFTNGKKYIGSAVHLSNRVFYGHLTYLRSNKHGNILLQRHFNKYGEGDLWFDILERCNKFPNESTEHYRQRLLSREQFYIDTLKPEFNICPVAGSSLGMKHPPRSEESKQKYSEALRQAKIKNWADPEYRKKHSEGMRGNQNAKRFKMTRTKPLRRGVSLSQNHNEYSE